MYSTYTKENSMFKVLKCFDMLTLRLKEGLKDVYFSYILILLKLLYELPNLFLLKFFNIGNYNCQRRCLFQYLEHKKKKGTQKTKKCQSKKKIKKKTHFSSFC